MSHIATAMKLRDVALEANRVLRAAAEERNVKVRDVAVGAEFLVLQQAGQELMKYLVEHFPGTPINNDWNTVHLFIDKVTTRDEAEKIVIDASSEAALAAIDPSCVPFIILRHSIAELRCVFDTQSISAFADFAGKFKHIIMRSAGDPPPVMVA